MGGTERAFMSTTTSRDVAMIYIAGREMATIFSIQVSAVSKGASISHLSQFPGEEEVLMPPGSFLEVVGAPQVVTLDDGTTSVLEIPMQISCPKMVTIEETRASRRTGLRAMVEHALLEIHRDLEALSKEERVARRAEGDAWCTFEDGKEDTTVAEPTREPSLHNAGLLPAIERECREWMERAIASRDLAIFNADEHYQRVVREASELKRLALNKVLIWLEDPNVNARAVKAMTLAEADRHAIGRWARALREAKDAVRNALPLPSVATWWPEARSQLAVHVSAAAMRVCRNQGLVVAAAHEVLDESSGETMLMRQAALGNTSAVGLLADAGARADAVDQGGRTALMYAAGTGQRETAVFLVRACGVDAGVAG